MSFGGAEREEESKREARLKLSTDGDHFYFVNCRIPSIEPRSTNISGRKQKRKQHPVLRLA